MAFILPAIIKTAPDIINMASPIAQRIMPIMAKFLLPLSDLSETIPKTSPIIADIPEGINVQQQITENIPKARDKMPIREFSGDTVAST